MDQHIIASAFDTLIVSLKIFEKSAIRVVKITQHAESYVVRS